MALNKSESENPIGKAILEYGISAILGAMLALAGNYWLFNNQLTTLQNRLDAKSGKLDELSDITARMATDLENTRRDVIRLQDQTKVVENLRVDQQTSSTNQSVLYQKITDHNLEIESLRTKMNSVEIQVGKADAISQTIQLEIEDLRTKMNSVEIQLGKADSISQAIQLRVGELEGDYHDVNEAIAALRERMAKQEGVNSVGSK